MLIFAPIILVWGGFVVYYVFGTEFGGGRTFGRTFYFISIAVGLIFSILSILILTGQRRTKAERDEYADFYMNYRESEIYTKFNIRFFDKGKRIWIKKPVIIDKTGFRNNEIDVQWQDFRQELEKFNAAVTAVLFLKFAANNYDAFFTVQLDQKTFYLIKNYCGITVEHADELEKWVRGLSILGRNRKKEEIPENAQKFKSYLWMIYTGILAVILAVIISFVFIAIKFKITNYIFIPVMIILGLFAITAVVSAEVIMPKGTTYINNEFILNRSLEGGDIKIEFAKAEIIRGKYIIKFKTAFSIIKIFKTKRALSWLDDYCINPKP